MPQESDPDAKTQAAMASARQILEEVAAEPIPESIATLAAKLEYTLSKRRKSARGRDEETPNLR